MPITVEYPHSPITAEPARLSARQVWGVAQAVRKQVVEDAFARKLDAAVVASSAGELDVNGIAFSAHWDLEHAVLNEAARPVMGTAEFDPVQPDSIYVSINGVALGGRDDLLRSTVAHELGHVVFDAPGWIQRATVLHVAGFDGGARIDKETSGAGQGDPPVEWREFRANEFMGAFLAPPGLLRVDLQRFAKRYRFERSSVPSRVLRGAPAYDARALEEEAVREVVFGMAEQYGLSEPFIRVRLDRYDLLRTGRDHAV